MALVAPGPANAAETTFYGKANARLQRHQSAGFLPVTQDGGPTDEQTHSYGSLQDNWELNSNASRLGFRGATDVRSGIEALFRLEYEIALDDGEAGGAGDPFKPRNVYAGIRGQWGEVVFGRNDTLLKSLGKTLWVFADYDNGDFLQGDDRRDNMVLYQSARWRGFRFGGAFSPGEAKRGDDAGETDSGLADYTGWSVEYERENRFALALAANHALSDSRALANGAPPPSGALDGLRVTARWMAWPGFSVGVMAQAMRDADGSEHFEERGALLGAAYRHGDWKFKLQRGASRRRGAESGANSDHRQTALGAEYWLDESVMLFVHFFSTRNGGVAVDGGDAKKEDDVLGAGMEYRF